VLSRANHIFGEKSSNLFEAALTMSEVALTELIGEFAQRELSKKNLFEEKLSSDFKIKLAKF